MTSSYGVQGFTADHLAAMKAHGTERVLIAYDNDDAGNAAARELGREARRPRHHELPGALPARHRRQPLRLHRQARRRRPSAVLLRSAEYMAGPVVSRPVALTRPAAAAQPAPQPPPQPGPPPPLPEPASPLAAASQAVDEADAVDISDMVEAVEQPRRPEPCQPRRP